MPPASPPSTPQVHRPSHGRHRRDRPVYATVPLPVSRPRCDASLDECLPPPRAWVRSPPRSQPSSPGARGGGVQPSSGSALVAISIAVKACQALPCGVMACNAPPPELAARDRRGEAHRATRGPRSLARLGPRTTRLPSLERGSHLDADEHLGMGPRRLSRISIPTPRQTLADPTPPFPLLCSVVQGSPTSLTASSSPKTTSSVSATRCALDAPTQLPRVARLSLRRPPHAQAREVLVEESNVQPVRCPVTVCGDIHGQFVRRCPLCAARGAPQARG